jgi:protoheme IX farnesyltransferase
MDHPLVVRVPARRETIGAYINLLKPHVTVLLLGTTLASMAVAADGWPGPRVTLATLLGGAMAAGSANALNCYWDRDIDALMARTRTRSLPAGRVTDSRALIFGLALGVGSVTLLATVVNPLSALLALAAILFYVLIYTMLLKRHTAQNIVIGGAAGAVPVLVGWAAVTGTLAPLPLCMFLIIFMWTPAHFWALALPLKNDYARAGVPMLPVARGEETTRRQILVYSVLLLATSLLPVALHGLGALYLAGALLCGLTLVGAAARLLMVRTLAAARTMFWLSNNYLALLFALMVLDRVLR